MSGLISWIREQLSPEVTPTTRRKRSNAWLGNDRDERAVGETTAVAVTGTSTSTATAGAASGNAGVRRVAVFLWVSRAWVRSLSHGTHAAVLGLLELLGRVHPRFLL